jgi:hypothetical protein
MRFHRAHFHGVFLSNLPPSCTTHNAKRLKSYFQPRSRTSPITLAFTDGTTATCDVLIGADGIKSTVRSFMLQELAKSVHPDAKQSVLSCITPVWSGVTAYRTLISAEKLRARCPDHRALRESVQVSLVGVVCHSVNLTSPWFTVLGKGCCEALYPQYPLLALTRCSSSLYTLFLMDNTSTLRVLRFSLILSTLPMKSIQEIHDPLFEGRLTTSGLANLPLNSSSSLSRTSKRTHNPFSRSVISQFVSKSLFFTDIFSGYTRRHALGCSHRKDIALHQFRASRYPGRCCSCDDAVPRRWCRPEYRGQLCTSALAINVLY